MQVDALNSHLKPLKMYLDDPTISEILVNRPHEIYVEKQGSFAKVDCKALSLNHLKQLSSLIANFNKKPFCEKHPRLAAKLPQGHRVQIVIPPIVEEGLVGLSIRKQVIANRSLVEYDSSFYSTSFKQYAREKGCITQQLPSGSFDALAFLEKAIKFKKTILISGGTSTGKTTFLNACLKTIPLSERLIVLEDTREVHLEHPNHLCLIAGHTGDSAQQSDMDDNLKASLRLRPDRIIVGELRGEEAATFLDAASTGHEGSFATIHASNPNLALERMSFLCEKAGMRQQSRASLRHHIQQVIDVVVQLKRDDSGRRFICDIWSFE